MSHRREKMESSLQRIIGQIISAGLNDPRICGLISVTEVRISTEGRRAMVKVSVLPADKASAVIHGLRDASGHIRREALRRLHTRSIPFLEFDVDETLKRQAAVFDAINQGVAEDEARRGASEEEVSVDEEAAEAEG